MTIRLPTLVALALTLFASPSPGATRAALEQVGFVVAVAAYAEAVCPGVTADYSAVEKAMNQGHVGPSDQPRLRAVASEIGRTFKARIEHSSARTWCGGAVAMFGPAGLSDPPFLRRSRKGGSRR